MAVSSASQTTLLMLSASIGLPVMMLGLVIPNRKKWGYCPCSGKDIPLGIGRDLWGKQMRRSFLFGFVLALISVSNANAQEYQISDGLSSCIGWFRGPDGRDIPAATIHATVSDWKPYIKMEEGSRLINSILREGIPRCEQRGSKPQVVNVRVTANNARSDYMLHVRLYRSTSGSRLETVANNISVFLNEERLAQQKGIDQENAAKAAAERVQIDAQQAQARNMQLAEEKRARDQAAVAAYDEQLKQVKAQEKAAEEAAAVRAKAKPADSFCMFSCDPLETQGRQVLKNELARAMRMPVIVRNFIKTEGVKMTVAGSQIYEMRYTVDLDFPIGLADRPKGDYYAEMESASTGSARFFQLNEMMRLEQKSKGPKWWDASSYSATGTLRFMKVDRGWMGQDDKVY